MATESHPAERARLRSAVSRLLDVFVAREATAEQLTSWAEVVEPFVDRVEQHPPDSLFWGLGNKGIFAVDGVTSAAGVHPPVVETDDSVRALVTFGVEQQGHRGLAHGGAIAHTFDDLFGSFHTASTAIPFTSELNIRYLKPVPLEREVVFEAEIAAVERRQVRAIGRALIDGVVHVEADALFVRADPHPQPLSRPAGEGSHA